MDFSSAKKAALYPQKERKLQTFLLGLLVSAAFFVPYMIISEGYFTFFGDFNVQQIPFYQLCHKAISEGNIGWSWYTDLGANFIGSYSFYLLGSPFFWITLLFPNSFVPYLMGPLLILKFGLASLTGYMYIRRFTKTSYAASLGGLMYAFSGFSIYNIFFNHFHEAIVVFPLLLLALELLITENRRGVFALAVCVSELVNYFFFFGMVVFCIIYFFVRLFSGAIKIKFSRFCVVALEAVLGVLMAAVLLVPSLMAIMGNSRVSEILLGWNAMVYGKEQIYTNVLQCFFFPPDLPARPVFFPGADVEWSSLGGWLPLFSMVGVLTCFSQRKGSWLKRLIGICAFMALVPILNSAFYAFNDSYYARWFYMPILIMCLASVMLTEDSSVDWNFGYKWTLGVTLAVTLVIGFFPRRFQEGKTVFGLYTYSQDGTYVIRFWITCLIAIVSLIIMGVCLKLVKQDRKAFYRMAISCVCIISIIYANVFVATGRTHSYEVKETMIDRLIEGEVYLDDDTVFRTDVYDGVDNTGMYLGYPCINAFHSVVPSSIMEFYEYLGIERSVASRPETDYPALRPLLSVKYLFNRTDGDSFADGSDSTIMSRYKYLKTSGGYYVYENLNYVPFGFSYEKYMSYDFCKEYDDETKSRLMLKAVLLTDKQIEKYGDILENIDQKELDAYGQYYTKYINFSDESMVLDCERLRKTAADSFVIDNSGFTAQVSRLNDSLVFFSVPYDEGWSATVNGQEVEIEKVNVGFMAVKVPRGESTIRFDYRTPGLKMGAIVTLSAVAIFLIYLLISKRYNGVSPAQNVYPEGDALIELWLKEDIAERMDVEPYEQDEQDIEETVIEVHENSGGGFTVNTDIDE